MQCNKVPQSYELSMPLSFTFTPSQDTPLLISSRLLYIDCTFGYNEHASALEQISWEVSLDSFSAGLKAAKKTHHQDESVCQLVLQKLYHCCCDHRTMRINLPLQLHLGPSSPGQQEPRLRPCTWMGKTVSPSEIITKQITFSKEQKISMTEPKQSLQN